MVGLVQPLTAHAELVLRCIHRKRETLLQWNKLTVNVDLLVELKFYSITELIGVGSIAGLVAAA